MQQVGELHILQCGFSREIKVIKPHTKKAEIPETRCFACFRDFMAGAISFDLCERPLKVLQKALQRTAEARIR